MDHNQLLASTLNIPQLTGPGLNPGTSKQSAVLAMEKIISNLIGILTIIAVIYFTIQVILAGYAYISAEGDPKSIDAARKRLTDGVLGLTIVIVAIGLASLIATIFGIDSAFVLGQVFVNMGL
jgi:hypothetical protein